MARPESVRGLLGMLKVVMVGQESPCRDCWPTWHRARCPCTKGQWLSCRVRFKLRTLVRARWAIAEMRWIYLCKLRHNAQSITFSSPAPTRLLQMSASGGNRGYSVGASSLGFPLPFSRKDQVLVRLVLYNFLVGYKAFVPKLEQGF